MTVLRRREEARRDSANGCDGPQKSPFWTKPISGLDIDALRIVSEGVNRLSGPDLGVLSSPTTSASLNYIKPQFVHIMMDGRSWKAAAPPWRSNSKSAVTTGCAKEENGDK